MTRRSAIAAVLAGVCLLSACKNGDAPEVLPSADASAVPATSAPPLVVPPLDREALLLAMARAASDAALGREPSQAQRDLDGKRFVLRMPGVRTSPAHPPQWRKMLMTRGLSSCPAVA